MSGSGYSTDEDDGGHSGLSLSAETIAALKDFAVASGIPVLGGEVDDPSEFNIVDVVRDHFDVKDRDEKFLVEYSTKDGSRHIRFEVLGVKRRLGQTLESTGLTIWRAAEHLCEFSFHHPEIFRNKSVCELGCGLGMVSILLDKMKVCSSILATDGDDSTMDLLRENIRLTDCSVSAEKLYWGRDIEAFVTQHPERFDILIAADVIYEEDQVLPLIETVVAILKENESSEFILAFARRNVPIDLVLSEAVKSGLQWEVLDAGEGGIEPIYRLTRKT